MFQESWEMYELIGKDGIFVRGKYCLESEYQV